MSSPSSRILPLVGSMSRLIMRRIVDLPQPDGPISADEIARRHLERQRPDGDRAVVVPLADAVQRDRRGVRGGRGTVHVCPSQDCRDGSFAGWPARALPADAPNPWFSWRYIQQIADQILTYLQFHFVTTIEAVVAAMIVAIPLAVLCYWVKPLAAPILALSGVLYTIPSLALFAFLAPFVGIGVTTILIGLVLYALLLMIQNTLTGLQQVPEDVLDAARGMGYGRFGMLWRVELPLALPGIITGIRLATVSTVALLTVGVIVGQGGLGQLIFSGSAHNLNKAAIFTGTLLCVALGPRPRPGHRRHRLARDAVGSAEGRAVNFIHQAIIWLNDPLNWTNPNGILRPSASTSSSRRSRLPVACAIALPDRHLVRTRRPRRRVSGRDIEYDPGASRRTRCSLSLSSRASPDGAESAVPALAIFGIPPILANAYTGIREVDPEVRDAARGMGMSGRQLLGRVEFPLAVPYIAAGFRTAAVQIVATATLAALVAGGGLGDIIYAGFGLTIAVGGGQILAGGFLVALLALLVNGVLGIVVHYVTPKPLRAQRRYRRRARRLAAETA